MSNNTTSSDGPSWSVFGNSTCLDPNSPDAVWPYCPSLAAAVLFLVLFLGSTIANIYFAAKFKVGFCWVLIMGAAWEFLGFTFRTLGTQYQQAMAFYVPQLLLILLSPLWINAFIYMLFARMVYYFDESKKVAFIPATKLGILFICLDIVTFFVQLAGASMLTSTDATSITNGKNIYMAGIGFQQAFILVFIYFVIRFHLRVRQSHTPRPTHYNPTVYLIYTCLALITVRIIFRFVEYSQGFQSPIPHTESYQFIFDAVPMLCATLVWCVWHPGRVLIGEDAKFPTRKQKKFLKTQKKAMKAHEKAMRKDSEKGQLLSGASTPERGASPVRGPSPARSGPAVYGNAYGGTPGPVPSVPTSYFQQQRPAAAARNPSVDAYYGADLAEEGFSALPQLPARH